MRNDRLILAVTIAGVLAIYTALVFAFFSTEGESRQVYLLLLGVPLAAFLVLFPRATLIVLAIGAYSFRWLYDTVGALPREATWLVDILIVVLVGRALLFMPTHKGRFTGIVKYILVLLAFAGVSSLVNHNGQITFIAGIRIGFRYIMLFVAAMQMDVSPRWIRNYIIFLFVIAAIQFPVIVGQFRHFGWGDPDRLSGTLGYGETPGIGLFLLVLDAYLLTKMIEESRFRMSYAMIIAGLSILPVLGEVKFYFLFMPILLAFIIRAELIKRPAVAIAVMMVGISVILAANFFVVKSGIWITGRNPLTFITRLPAEFQTEIQKGEDYGYSERGFLYASAIRLAAASPRTIFLGNGPGSVTDSYMSEKHSGKLAYYAQWGLTSMRAMSILWLLIEYGYFGVGLIFVLIYMIFRRGRILRQSSDVEIRVFGRLLECLTLLFSAWLFYESAWQQDAMSFSFWPLAGLLVGLSYHEEALQKAQAINRIKEAAIQPAPSALPAQS